MAREHVSTPQLLGPLPTQRSSYETELWDDMSNVVFDAFAAPNLNYSDGFYYGDTVGDTEFAFVEVPCPVPTRLQITWWAQWSAPAGDVDCTVGAVANSVGLGLNWPQFKATIGATMFMPLGGTVTYDVPAGLIPVTIFLLVGTPSVDIGMYTNFLTVRRGRRP